MSLLLNFNSSYSVGRAIVSSLRKRTNTLWPSLIFHTDFQSPPKLPHFGGDIGDMYVCLLEPGAKNLGGFSGESVAQGRYLRNSNSEKSSC